MKTATTTCALLALALTACQTTAPDATSQQIATARERGHMLPIESVAPQTLAIDGDLRDWGDLPAHGAIVCPQLDTSLGQYQGHASAAAVALKTDGQSLYLAMHIVDPDLIVRDPGWTGDCVELFLDVRPVHANAANNDEAAAKCLRGPKYGDGVYQLVLTPPRQAGDNGRWTQANRAQAALGPIDYASRLTPDGYTIEARIPFSSLHNVTAARLREPIGFGAMIDDINHLPGRQATTPRLGYNWCATGDSWHDPGTLGLAEVGPRPTPTPGPIVRAQGGRYISGWDSRQVTLGVMVPTGTTIPQDAAAVAMGLEGQPSKPLDVTWTRVPYPSLGVDVLQGVAPVTEINSGKYILQTTFHGGKQVQTRFDAIAWHAPATAVLRQTPAITVPGPLADGTTLLHSGWKLTPAGRHIRLSGDMPVRMTWGPAGQLLVTTAGFQEEGLHVVDVAAGKEIKFVDLGRIYTGLCATAPDEYLISGANGDQGSVFAPVHRVKYDGKTWSNAGPVAIDGLTRGKDCFISGLATGKDGAVFVANLEGDEVLKLVAGKTAAKAKVGYHPYALAVSPDGTQLAVSNWGDESVTILNTADLAPAGGAAVGRHPNDLLYAKDGRLFVSCAGSNAVSVIAGGKVIETITTSLDPQAPVGSTPVALAISADASRLFVANADNNAVAVVDTSVAGKSRVLGFIPTGWYPTALTLSPDGKKLYVGVGKGLSSMRVRSPDYIPRLFEGAISEVDLPDADGLAAMTRQVLANTPKAVDDAQLDEYAQGIRRDVFPKIKHILYIIRENRTYDQVFGDIAKGNGDPSLAMFGKDVTPNAHRLAEEFMLLDNIYCSGEVSEDGHEWCNAAYATDFEQKAWIQSYSGRSEPKADERLTESPGGYLWTNCAKHGKTYRSYGEFASFTAGPDKAPVFQGDRGLKGHASLKWDQVEGRDPDRAKVFIEELAEAEKTGQWPQYMVMGLGEDHTAGLSPGRFTPAAMVASNDQALGMMVEAVSKSRFWKDTAIFVIEDDAQDGHDHVDAHRTVALVISPYTRRGAVDSTMYSTVSMVRTMETILGLPAMTQFDSAAPVMYRCFADTGSAGLAAYTNVPPRIDLLAKNPKSGPDAEASAKLDWSKVDKADPIVLNGILWRAWKPITPEPAPVRRLVPLLSAGDADND